MAEMITIFRINTINAWVYMHGGKVVYISNVGPLLKRLVNQQVIVKHTKKNLKCEVRYTSKV